MPKKNLNPENFLPLSLIGEGGHGKVYLVYKSDPEQKKQKVKDYGKLYAMKVLEKSYFEAKYLSYILNERNLMAYHKHTFIISLNYAF